MGLRNWITSLIDNNEREVKKLRPLVEKINALETEMQKLSPEDFPAYTQKLRSELEAGASLDDILPPAFALE